MSMPRIDRSRHFPLVLFFIQRSELIAFNTENNQAENPHLPDHAKQPNKVMWIFMAKWTICGNLLRIPYLLKKNPPFAPYIPSVDSTWISQCFYLERKPEENLSKYYEAVLLAIFDCSRSSVNIVSLWVIYPSESICSGYFWWWGSWN